MSSNSSHSNEKVISRKVNGSDGERASYSTSASSPDASCLTQRREGLEDTESTEDQQSVKSLEVFNTSTDNDNPSGAALGMRNLYKKIFTFSTLTRYILICTPLAFVFAIPIVICSFFPSAELGVC